MMNFAKTEIKDVGLYTVKVYSQLSNSVATSSSITFKVNVTECLPTSFKGPSISDKKITATKTEPFEVDVTFD